MYTSEIRETDAEGRPVAVSPELLARVRAADDALRERLLPQDRLEYSGRWVFPETGKALFSIQVRVPDRSDTFAASLWLGHQPTEAFTGRAIHTVLEQADRVLAASIKRRLHDLQVASGEDE